MKLTALHVTDPKVVPRILEEGFRLDVPSRRDAGDLGEAIYLTTDPVRARAMGGTILYVNVELRNPLTLDVKAAYALVMDELGFDTIHGHGNWENRHKEAAAARKHFLRKGHDALVMKRKRGDLEIAVYDLDAIKSVRKNVEV